jgi:hypothetical protein
MLKLISLMPLVAMLSLITWNSSCASLDLDSPPQLLNRTLRISPDHPGSLEYQYIVCTRHFLLTCVETKAVKDYYDLNDAATRTQLINMNFIVHVREKVQ